MSDEGKLIPPDHNPAEEAFEFGAAESLQAYDLTDGMYEYPHMPTMFQHVTEEMTESIILRASMREQTGGLEPSTMAETMAKKFHAEAKMQQASLGKENIGEEERKKSIQETITFVLLTPDE